MTKLEFLKIWLERKGYAEKAAVQSIISIQFEDEDSSGMFKKVPLAVFVENNKFHVIIDGETVTVDGKVEEPLFVSDTLLNVPSDYHPALQGTAVETTFGLLLFNIILFWEVFGTKVPYINEEFTKKLIKNTLSNLMVDNPKEGESVPEGKASVDDCIKFTRHCNYLEGLGTYFVKPGGIETLTVSKAILKRKEELFSQLRKEGKINDPVAFTKVVEELVDMDRKEMMSGPSANFFIDDKYISNARKRMFIAFGIEPKGDGYVGLPMSLDEGMDPNEIVSYINTAVVGSYSRSMATGQGGAKVKDFLKLVGRRIVSGVDCGTTLGESWIINNSSSGWTGSYYIVKGKSELLTSEIIQANVGKELLIRTPNYCLTTDGNYCAMCCGEGLGKLANRLSAEVVNIPTKAMLLRMKAQHVSGLNTVTVNLKDLIK